MIDTFAITELNPNGFSERIWLNAVIYDLNLRPQHFASCGVETTTTLAFSESRESEVKAVHLTFKVSSNHNRLQPKPSPMKFFATIALCALAGATAESTTVESARQLRAAAGSITKWEITPDGKGLAGLPPSNTCFQITCDFGGNMQACAPNLAARLQSELVHAKSVTGKGVYSVSGNAVTFYSTSFYPGSNRITTVVTGTCDGRTFNGVCQGPGNSAHKC